MTGDDPRNPAGPAEGQPKVTAYAAGSVPGVDYASGEARSPREASDPIATPMPPSGPAPEPEPAPRVVTPLAAEPQRRAHPARPAAAPRVDHGTRVMPATAAGDGQGPPAGPPPSARAENGPRRPRRRRRWGRWLLLVVVVLLVAMLALFAYAWTRIERVAAVPDDHGDAVSEGRVVLLVGSDSREGLSDEQRSEFGTGSVEGRRTDTIMLLHTPTNGSPALISVPRDSLVDVPGRGAGRINAAYAFGGAPLLVETVEANTGVAIDDYIEVGFGGFVSVVDAIGGVEMCLDDAISDERAHIDLPAGCQTLNGRDALGLARARYFDPRADLARVENQRRLMGAIADKGTSVGTLINPIAMTRLALSGGDALILDEQTGPVDVVRFARAMGAVSGDSGVTLTVPLAEVGNTVTWDEQQAGLLWESLREGTEVPAELLTDS